MASHSQIITAMQYFRTLTRRRPAGPPTIEYHLARDNKMREVVILVYPPHVFRPIGAHSWGPTHLHWSLSWRADEGGWVHLHVDTEDTPHDPQHRQRYVYRGPEFKTADLEDASTREAHQVSLGVIPPWFRERIVELASSVDVAEPHGYGSSRCWVIDLLREVMHDGIIKDAMFDEVVEGAEKAAKKLLADGCEEGISGEDVDCE
ncbi:hypothetical protein OH76DRAFT_1485728 [Lentinus brumalis]|uniref:Uncharacterized protein n=1 Tax=Lentinus brumalis TaxID=2498619 RepID=A0A371D0Q9_9APHY|nr:hypothetical protein OH76DRAFT_1485728 [Polyporus brumalis]